MTRVKICGITSREDARIATDLGVDALGFLVGLAYESEDQLSADDADKIVQGLPPYVDATLVTHRTDPRDVRDLLERVRPQVVQLHGEYPLERIVELREAFPAVKVVKTVHVADEGSLGEAEASARHADAVLLDTKAGTRTGGTGVVHDWALSRRIRDLLTPTPVILAGGLTPANVAAAIETVAPYALDVNSGVSVRRGKKSPQLIEAFLRAAGRGRREDHSG